MERELEALKVRFSQRVCAYADGALDVRHSWTSVSHGIFREVTRWEEAEDVAASF